MTDQDIEILQRDPVYRGYARVDRYRLRHRKFDGSWSEPMSREVLERGHVVGVLPYDPVLDQVVLIEQFRMGAHAAGRPPWQIEVVAGIMDPGETVEAVARRETLEEIGCTVSTLEAIGGYVVSPGISSETVHLFCARVDAAGAEGIHGLAHEHEDIRAFAVPAAKAIGWLDTPRLDNGLTIVALGWLARHHEALRHRWRS
ncbi:MAG: NUDIX domain-containing protein [Azospirillum sp.]|nr:NUDIX domain-containing protein [Azospirillum sp.]